MSRMSGKSAAFRRIVVRAPNWIGDAVMCEPALRGLRSLFPQAELTLLAKPAIAELFVAYPGLNHVVRYEDKGIHAGLSGKWTLAGTLRRQRFDLAVLFQNAFEAALLTWLAGMPRRYGYATDGRVFFLTDPVAVPDRQALRHQVHYYWDMLRPLGLAGTPASPMLTLHQDEERAMDRRLVEAGIAETDLVLGINPGSTYGGAKRWLPERFAETVARLSLEIGRQQGRTLSVIILGAKGEEELGQAIAARLGIRSVVLSGKTTIRELMAATKRCALLVTNDTGPMHIAAAFGVPVVAVFGPTDWRTTAPYGQEQGMVRHPVECAPCLLRECPIDHRCMTGVTVDQVYEAGLSCLSGQRSLSSLSGRGGSSSTDQTDQIDRTDQTDRTDLLHGVTVFLDRDGTLNPDPGYIRSPEQFELFPGVPEALARLTGAGARLVLVTNQSGIGRGFFSTADLEQIHAKLRRLAGEAGASFAGMYFCPHHPDETCHCRKPETGMVEQAVNELAIDLSRSYLVGDHAKDMELARRIGAKRVLVKTKVHGSPEEDGECREADAVVSSLSDAAEWILADANQR
ncbi:MAG: D-glycero-beta-D-manno-heptose 1,7-bisphosphate 7-phosphatase [Nitrospira sp.]|jgi:heptosyltransferase-2|nr:D-glycero-beta-D-manno-heptose 1,7-bisphosphate 7-phosphatase [Nitrospira sp.]